MSDIALAPEVPLQIITAADVRASIRRARQSLGKAADEIVWQIEMEAWRTLGYSSWTAMREAEYGDAAFMVPSRQRPELVARMRAKGLTQQEIAATAGVNRETVANDIRSMSESGIEVPPAITNSRGQQRPATYTRAEPEDVIDAEVIEDDGPIHVNRETGEITDTTTGPAPTADPAAPPTTTCPTCGGTGKVTR